MPNAKAILIHYRWNREKVASESKAEAGLFSVGFFL